jgi:hypothetical protein
VCNLYHAESESDSDEDIEEIAAFVAAQTASKSAAMSSRADGAGPSSECHPPVNKSSASVTTNVTQTQKGILKIN